MDVTFYSRSPEDTTSFGMWSDVWIIIISDLGRPNVASCYCKRMGYFWTRKTKQETDGPEFCLYRFALPSLAYVSSLHIIHIVIYYVLILSYTTIHYNRGIQYFVSVDRIDFGKCRQRAGFKKSGLKLANIVMCCVTKVNTCKINYLPHRNNITIKVWSLQTYLVQDLVHQCDVRNCLEDKISSKFGSNLVIRIVKIDVKFPCYNEVRYLDLTHLSELRLSNEEVKGSLVAFSDLRLCKKR